MTTNPRILLALLAVAGAASPSLAQDSKPTILVPAEKCPQYVNLLQRYTTSAAKRSGIRDCRLLLDERDRLLRGMLAYGQNASCYSYGWKGAEVVSFLQTLIDRNHTEKLRCEGWLASGRVCEDGSLCAPGTTCTAQRLCVARAQGNENAGETHAAPAPESRAMSKDSR